MMSQPHTHPTPHDLIITYLSLGIVALVVLVSITGIFSHAFYALETPNWQVQSMGQDIVDLFLVAPVLLISTILFRKMRIAGKLVWAGTLIYVLYTFLIYCFGVHFNRLFPVYCITLGLTFYTLFYFIYIEGSATAGPDHPRKTIAAVTGYFLLAIAVLFYLLWLSEIVPAIQKGIIPASLIEVGLPTNPVHVIDLSICLPGIFIAGILLLKRRTIGYLLAPAILTFFILMDLTIVALMLILRQHTLTSSPGAMFVMAVLALISLLLLILNLRQYRTSVG